MIFAGIECDSCGKAVYYDHASKKWVIRLSREKGWKIGKLCTCPACVEKKQIVKNNTETSGRKEEKI
jgi:hypothetical protein